MRKMGLFAAGLIAATAFASNANAQDFLTIAGASGPFGSNNVGCAMGAVTPCSFTRALTFTTPTGFNLSSLDISSVATSAATDINFTSVLFNGTNFSTVLTGTQEFRNLLNQSLVAGGLNTISVAGTTGGAASFSGNLSFASVAAVPEPGTWALMLLGFGAVGFSMRRRRSGAYLLQAA